jgi:hypothetical protein
MKLCPTKLKKKSSTRLPKWQEDISRAVREMDAYTQEELAEEELLEPDGDDDAPAGATHDHE